MGLGILLSGQYLSTTCHYLVMKKKGQREITSDALLAAVPACLTNQLLVILWI